MFGASAFNDKINKLFSKKKQEFPTNTNQIVDDTKDGAVVGDMYTTYYNNDIDSLGEASLISTYREISTFAEVDFAIEDIVNEMVSYDDDQDPLEINLDNLEINKKVKDEIQLSFDKITKILDLKSTIHERVRRFYVDGKMSYQKIINLDNPKDGIINLIELDPIFIKKYKEIDYDEDKKTIKSITYFYKYSEANSIGLPQKSTTSQKSNKPISHSEYILNEESIVYATSGNVGKNGFPLGWLHKAVKPANQLMMMQNALIVQRVTRAPERRIFNVDVTGIPRAKQEAHIQEQINNYRNKMTYDPETGSFKDKRYVQMMQEDYWFPRNDGRGTTVDTLQSGVQLGDIDDIKLFLERLYKALNIPASRLSSDSVVNLGKSTEINRDELKFSKFIKKLRARWIILILESMKTDLILKKIISEDEWNDIEQDIEFKFAQDFYLEEMKQTELLMNRLDVVERFSPYIGKYVSNSYIRKEILKQTENDVTDIDKEIADEVKSKQYNPDDGVPE